VNKAILHDHLDGGLRPSTAKELAYTMKYKPLLEIDDIFTFFDRSNSSSLEDYLEAFIHTTALMTTYENLERIAFEAAEDMHNEGITHYESRYAPLYSVNKNLSIENVINAINSGFNQANKIYGIKCGLILCGMRNDKNNVEQVTEIAIEYKDKIIGFDIAGPELNYRPSIFKSSFDKLQKNKINITIHAGEGDNVESIKDALDNGAMRIGHGVRIIEDIDIKSNSLGNTASYILDKQIPLEICITSNIHTNMYKSFEEHPVSKLINLGFNVSLNTDNRLMSNTNVQKEIDIAKNLGINNIDELFKRSASYSFLN
tara:strand:- start:2326 stop:3270 length:945 start_codon:yes stop_codon:yes gene_type:complete